MKVLFEGSLHVDYGFVHLASDLDAYDPDYDQRAGQRNGLAGAAQPGFVLLTTGTSYGDVPIRVERFASRPRVDERWDEVVEVSCDFRGRRLWLSVFDDAARVGKLRDAGPHRVRFSALRFDDPDERADDQIALDRYLVQVWPAPMEQDRVLKQTSESAAYWHRTARKARRQNPSPQSQALAEDAERKRRVADERTFEKERRLWSWGGREPSSAMVRVGRVGRLAIDHRDLVDRIEVLGPERQRALAVAVARQACAADVDSPVDWSPALGALAVGDPLPPPFDDEDAVRAMMFGPAGETVAVARVSTAEALADRPRIHTGVSAAAAVRAAAEPDPFAAAIRAIEAASWSAPQEASFFADVVALT